ncbi:hypothetical protein Nham_3951 [Nitrobacter hamburgensis X14]|uniref:Uncharacterized protein n=1 Tax=Nitrobacter hamburgensis (strain DSM 10229 / NCIMB 13809 / X14) TaxID=323097 RepID=Q1QGL7_NITHX|nr:hypothetical protein [Nitrobacter hamburgensis]ABE64630.1 hypothetical protein Nham_3951 [Nitrobacter hamburgensis X14]
MAKRKKGSKTVPKGKAPLGELALPYEVPVGSFISPADVGRFRPRQQLQHDSYPIDREIAHMTGASPPDAESPSKMAMPPVTTTSEQSQASIKAGSSLRLPTMAGHGHRQANEA